ncbi:hypothetical protein PACTADRAFT_185512 [Pachysolen tannophilus NRRL Y-2460]|uniref:Uncharacterized protein n=1 Tax=Pachysolen tannophilus NRRL Y-2460 TaxID=669874 RepID=A0A1E4U257_PACTA|nr:hypothetical protein PACTADRAFT_185512 [Pachysolen tannophilus NRRL Y-2460]
MDGNRHVIRSKIITHPRSKTPYDRLISSTDGVFSRLKNIFRLERRSSNDNSQEEAHGETNDEPENSHTHTKKTNPFEFETRIGSDSISSNSTARIADKVKEMSSIRTDDESPNAKLAQFFARKGNEPISDIELEGVLSLINRSVTTDSSLSPRPTSEYGAGNDVLGGDMSFMRTNKSLESHNANISNTSHENYFEITTDSGISTPSYDPSFNFSKNENKKTESKKITSLPKRRFYKYSSVPSSHRTYLNPSIPTFRKVSKQNKVEKTESPKVEKKKLSKTATALLSLLDDTSHEKNNSDEKDNSSLEKLVNPYAFNSYMSITNSAKKSKDYIREIQKNGNNGKETEDQNSKIQQTPSKIDQNASNIEIEPLVEDVTTSNKVVSPSPLFVEFLPKKSLEPKLLDTDEHESEKAQQNNKKLVFSNSDSAVETKKVQFSDNSQKEMDKNSFFISNLEKQDENKNKNNFTLPSKPLFKNLDNAGTITQKISPSLEIADFVFPNAIENAFKIDETKVREYENFFEF